MRKSNEEVPAAVLSAYGFEDASQVLTPLQDGLINRTWKLETGKGTYIIQKINHEVFHHPEDIDHNIGEIARYLAANRPGYRFVAPATAIDGRTMVHDTAEGYFRVFPFVAGSHTKRTVQQASEAFEAAKQFGSFTAELQAFDSSRLRQTIPGFHDLGMRYRQFREAVKGAEKETLAGCAQLVRQLEDWSDIATEYEQLTRDPGFRLRVTHHDTKISNVLFDENDKGICVIDLDTVMPGYFISDVGDMMRTYLCPVSEEETDLSKITVRHDFLEAIVAGYLEHMHPFLTTTETRYFGYAAEFMIYMQALRFITDHLNGNIYYAVTHPMQNFDRAANQVVLLERLRG